MMALNSWVKMIPLCQPPERLGPQVCMPVSPAHDCSMSVPRDVGTIDVCHQAQLKGCSNEHGLELMLYKALICAS